MGRAIQCCGIAMSFQSAAHHLKPRIHADGPPNERERALAARPALNPRHRLALKGGAGLTSRYMTCVDGEMR